MSQTKQMDSNTKLPHLLLLRLLLFPFFHLLLFISNTDAAAIPHKNKSLNKTVSALFVFGDSTADPGNNNYVLTPMKSNFPPYGRDFPNHVPTGRFTNGRLANDFIISYLGIKTYLPPYLDPKLSINELMTGVSFASAGSGFDPLTPIISSVIPLPQQLENFKELKERIKKEIGEKQTENLIKDAAFLISAGTNDFVLNYFTLPNRRLTFDVSGYQNFVLKQVKDFIQGLSEQGARRIAVVGLPPLGCLPLVMTEFDPLGQRNCLDKYSSVARDYNKLLQLQLAQIQSSQTASNLKLYYADIYGPLQDMIQNRKQYGFEEVSRGCCGTGYLEAAILCNAKSHLCADASKYVFWDSIHPSEKTYEYIVKAFRHLIDAIIMDI